MRDHWIGWLQEKQRHFFYGVICVICSFFIAFQVFGRLHTSSNTRFLSVNQAFDHWMVQGEAFEKLEAALKQNPELESRYSAHIADKLIAQNEGKKASAIAQNVFKRVLDQTPEYSAFARASLLISEGKFNEALNQAIALKETTDENSILFGFNLVRIASLYRQLDDRSHELTALNELEDYLNTHEKTASVLTECFTEGSVTLSDYIHQRKSL